MQETVLDKLTDFIERHVTITDMSTLQWYMEDYIAKADDDAVFYKHYFRWRDALYTHAPVIQSYMKHNKEKMMQDVLEGTAAIERVRDKEWDDILEITAVKNSVGYAVQTNDLLQAYERIVWEYAEIVHSALDAQGTGNMAETSATEAGTTCDGDSRQDISAHYFHVANRLKAYIRILRDKTAAKETKTAATQMMKQILLECVYDPYLEHLAPVYSDYPEDSTLGYRPELVSRFVREVDKERDIIARTGKNRNMKDVRWSMETQTFNASDDKHMDALEHVLVCIAEDGMDIPEGVQVTWKGNVCEMTIRGVFIASHETCGAEDLLDDRALIHVNSDHETLETYIPMSCELMEIIHLSVKDDELFQRIASDDA